MTVLTSFLTWFADLRTGINCLGLDYDVSITGRGVISGETVPRASGAFGQCLFHIQMSGDHRVSIAGIAVVDAPMMQMCLGGGQEARPHEVRGVKLIAPESKNSDGIHAGPAQIVDDCFIVAHDDALDVGQGAYSSLITNTTVWNTWGSAILISWNARYDTGNAIVDGLDVIRWEGDVYNTNESVILIRHGCTGNLSNFTFSNIRVERTGINSRLLGWSIGPTSWSCDAPGCACGANASDANLGSISGITLRDVTMDGPSIGLYGGHNFLEGFSVDRQISDVRFEGLRINGTWITSAAAMGLEIGPFVSNVTFAAGAAPLLIHHQASIQTESGSTARGGSTVSPIRGRVGAAKWDDDEAARLEGSPSLPRLVFAIAEGFPHSSLVLSTREQTVNSNFTVLGAQLENVYSALLPLTASYTVDVQMPLNSLYNLTAERATTTPLKRFHPGLIHTMDFFKMKGNTIGVLLEAYSGGYQCIPKCQ